jgi:hypothetical protein
MIRSLATAATSSRGGSKNGNRIGALVVTPGSQKLDVAPSRLATGTLPGQCEKGASKNSALNSNNEAQSPSSPYSPYLRFRSRRSRRLDSAAAKPDAFRMCIYQEVVGTVSTGKASMRRAHSSR